MRDPHRFRLTRAGVLNVWQYDEQVFTFADGRLLLRGTNGAGKSKTLEMLLPFVLDGDKARMTATGRQGSQLLWLMTDGATGGSTRTGYLWVEFARTDAGGERHVMTCGVGIRHSTSARQVVTWQFTVPATVPALCEPDGTPLSQARLRETIAPAGGQVFDSPRTYKAHVGQLLFGLGPQPYDDLLRLLYWLRQPQVGEDLDPRRLVEMLDEALPALDEDAVRHVGEALDDLAEHGERVERLRNAAQAVQASAALYARYAATVMHERSGQARDAERERAARSRAVTAAQGELEQVVAELGAAQQRQSTAGEALSTARSRVQVLESGPLARNQQVLREKQRWAAESQRVAEASRVAADRAAERALGSRSRVELDRRSLHEQGRRLAVSATEAASALRGCALDAGLPEAAETVPGAHALLAAVPALRTRVSTARAAVTLVREALEVTQQRMRARDRAAERAADAERREEQAAGRLADAERELQTATQAWTAAVRAWLDEFGDVVEPGGAAVDDLAELTPEVAEALPARARQAVESRLVHLRAQQAAHAAERVGAEALLRELAERRRQVLAERDPSPSPPALARPDRDPRAGLPLWRLVDVRADSEQATAEPAAPARIEAALQASGLLDAQVLADGALRLADDTVLGLTGGPPAPVSLLQVLQPDVPAGSPVMADVVARILSGISLVDSDAALSPAIGRDGSWRLGPLTGRATKPMAQYIGSAAREAERARRLDAVDAEQQVAIERRNAASRAEIAASGEREGLELWLQRAPSSQTVRSALVLSEERARARDRAGAEATERAAALAAAGSELASALAQLRRLASEHGLPSERAELEERSTALLRADGLLESLADRASRLLEAARRLEEDRETAERDEDEARTAAQDADAAQRDARAAAQEAQALLDTLGADVQRMQRELDQAQRAARTASAGREAAGQRVLALTERQGEVRAGVEAAQVRLSEQGPVVGEHVARVAELAQVPGLLPAALDRQLLADEQGALAAMAAAGEAPPRGAVQLLGAWAALAVDRPADGNAVHAEIRSLAAGPAADQEPRVVPVGTALAVLARDAAGAEQPLGLAAERLAAEVVREQELLTERERSLFEEHLLGELGDALRARRAEASDLVRGMNDLLSGVRTSQGIRVRLDWELSEDAGTDVRDAVALLGRSRGALTPEETVRLRDALSALIEVQRTAEPEHGYAEHLARALDYRRWSAFSVRLQRPGVQGWTTLTRRTPLSQGEQKVVCYLPLFAAAAAHFTSVAGAAPHAPRLILLDDAFPKIDVRTHPLLFGLLVDLDLDFVLTSERLWGDHDSVPSLAVYEALRAPGERGIAQYRYTWDGSTLVGEG